MVFAWFSHGFRRLRVILISCYCFLFLSCSPCPVLLSCDGDEFKGFLLRCAGPGGVKVGEFFGNLQPGIQRQCDNVSCPAVRRILLYLLFRRSHGLQL